MLVHILKVLVIVVIEDLYINIYMSQFKASYIFFIYLSMGGLLRAIILKTENGDIEV